MIRLSIVIGVLTLFAAGTAQGDTLKCKDLSGMSFTHNGQVKGWKAGPNGFGSDPYVFRITGRNAQLTRGAGQWKHKVPLRNLSFSKNQMTWVGLEYKKPIMVTLSFLGTRQWALLTYTRHGRSKRAATADVFYSLCRR